MVGPRIQREPSHGHAPCAVGWRRELCGGPIRHGIREPGARRPSACPRAGTARAEVPLERARELTRSTRRSPPRPPATGRVVLLEGAGGIGKTLLLGHAIQRAQASGMTVLRARGGELERQFPFGVALQLFEPYLSAASPRERRRVLAGAAAHAAPLLSGDVGGARAARRSSRCCTASTGSSRTSPSAGRC